MRRGHFFSVGEFIKGSILSFYIQNVANFVMELLIFLCAKIHIILMLASNEFL